MFVLPIISTLYTQDIQPPPAPRLNGGGDCGVALAELGGSVWRLPAVL